jgi:hypothetical protein
MFIEPLTLIDQTIEDLHFLSELLADDPGERTHEPTKLTSAAGKCTEALGAAGNAMA